MKRIFALALLLVCLTAVPFATQAVAPKPSGKCVYILLDSYLDSATGCVFEHYMIVCQGGTTEITMKTCS